MGLVHNRRTTARRVRMRQVASSVIYEETRMQPRNSLVTNRRKHVALSWMKEKKRNFRVRKILQAPAPALPCFVEDTIADVVSRASNSPAIGRLPCVISDLALGRFRFGAGIELQSIRRVSSLHVASAFPPLGGML